MSREGVRVIDQLAEAGRRVLEDGARSCRTELDQLTASAYGFPKGLIDELVEAADGDA